jgi:hypothetical protein
LCSQQPGRQVLRRPRRHRRLCQFVSQNSGSPTPFIVGLI